MSSPLNKRKAPLDENFLATVLGSQQNL